LKFFFVYTIVVICLVTSCKQARKNAPVSRAKYIETIRDLKGLQQTKELNDITFLLKYRPIEEMILNDTGPSKLNDSLYKKLYERYKNLRYFTFAIKSDKVDEILEHENQEKDDYFKLLDYLSGQIQNDFYLVDGKDTVACALCHYERNYGLSAVNNISLAFDVKDSLATNDLLFVYDDKLFEVGRLNFRISIELLNEIPSIAYEK
jgi:hypothetical protein